MNSKLLGGILLVIGTTIGAGMLALPIATAELGFLGSLVLLVCGWAVMLACAFVFIEVNLWLPPNSNLISMAGATLGRAGQVVTWIFYLLLLYSILSAYVSGGGDIFHYLLNSMGLPISLSMASVLFTALFGTIVYGGIRLVDYVNRGLMFGKLSALLLLIAFIVPFIQPNFLGDGEFKQILAPTGMMVTAVSFANLMIIPSLRTYFAEDTRSLRLAVFWGMTIPLICYIAWDLAILGVIPLNGEPGLVQMLHSANSNSLLMTTVSEILQKNNVSSLIKIFTSICMTTSFLSVALSLSDFLADGLRVKKQGMGNVLVYAITFLPPVGIVIFYPGAFIRALNYAGVCCFVLMVLLPALMAWCGPYKQSKKMAECFQIFGGKFLLALLVIFATLMIGFGVEGAI